MTDPSTDGLLRWRAYTPGDAADVAAHHNLLAEGAGGLDEASTEAIEAYVPAWLRDPATDSRLVYTPDGALVATALVTLLPGDSLIGFGGSPGSGRAYCGVRPIGGAADSVANC